MQMSSTRRTRIRCLYQYSEDLSQEGHCNYNFDQLCASPGPIVSSTEGRIVPSQGFHQLLQVGCTHPDQVLGNQTTVTQREQPTKIKTATVGGGRG